MSNRFRAVWPPLLAGKLLRARLGWPPKIVGLKISYSPPSLYDFVLVVKGNSDLSLGAPLEYASWSRGYLVKSPSLFPDDKPGIVGILICLFRILDE